MAKVSNMSIPPSLQARFGEVASAHHTGNQPPNKVAINRSARAAQPAPHQKPLAHLASSAATWLRDNWKPGNPSQFFAEQRAAVMAGAFDPAYWQECAIIGDMTTYSIPEVRQYQGAINSNYFDALRQPTQSKWSISSSAYPTPDGNGSLIAPAPGWAGAVVNGKWRDLWLAQRHLTFALPHTSSKADDRPLALLFSGQIIAATTVAGNEAWFQLSSRKGFYMAGGVSPWPISNTIANWSMSDTQPLLLPGKNLDGWNFTLEKLVVRDCRLQAKWATHNGANRVTVKIIVPPSMGYLFSHNDSAQVKHRVTAQLFMGFGPNG